MYLQPYSLTVVLQVRQDVSLYVDAQYEPHRRLARWLSKIKPSIDDWATEHSSVAQVRAFAAPFPAGVLVLNDPGVSLHTLRPPRKFLSLCIAGES